MWLNPTLRQREVTATSKGGRSSVTAPCISRLRQFEMWWMQEGKTISPCPNHALGESFQHLTAPLEWVIASRIPICSIYMSSYLTFYGQARKSVE